METLFGSDICLTSILQLIKGKKPTVKQIVCFDKEVSLNLTDLAAKLDIKLLSY